MEATRLALRPGPRRADGRGDAVRGLDVRHAENVPGIGHRPVEQEIGAAVVEHRQHAEFLGDGAERRCVAARDDAGEEVDVLGQFHTAQLSDVGVGAGRLVGEDGLDLAPAEQPAFGIDLLGRHHVPFTTGLAQQIACAGYQRHVTGLVRPVGHGPLHLGGGSMRRSRSGKVGAGHRTRGHGGAGGDAEAVQERSAIHFHRGTSP